MEGKGMRGLAIGIGSLPHLDADSALDLIFKHLPEIPFWPQLPKRDVREGMVAQFSENLPCLKVGTSGLSFDPSHKEEELEIFYEHIIAGDRDYFKISPDFAAGLERLRQRLEEDKAAEFIKCQVTGPFTFAASINDDKGIALLHDSVLMQAILKGLAMKALWQLALFKRFGKKMIIFIDEPYLGSFGSAYTPINRQDIVGGLTELAADIKSVDCLLGVHCCGNTDWSIFTDIPGIDIINFDAFGFMDKFLLYTGNLKGFLERGGIICWGIVPTQEFTGREAADTLLKKINDGIGYLVRKGLDRNLLARNLLVSPACGLGTLDKDKSDKILQLLAETSRLIRGGR